MRRFSRHFLAFILAGMIIASGFIYLYFDFTNNNPIKKRIHLHVPDKQELNLVSGVYTVFYEYEIHNINLGPVQVSKSERMSSASSLLDIKIVNSTDSTVVQKTDDASTTYTMNNTKGESLYRFKINQPARYTITTQLRNKENKALITLMLIHGFDAFLFGAFRIIGITILIALPFLLVGLYCYVREKKRKRALISKTSV
jgi:hypothetical protein